MFSGAVFTSWRTRSFELIALYTSLIFKSITLNIQEYHPHSLSLLYWLALTIFYVTCLLIYMKIDILLSQSEILRTFVLETKKQTIL